MSQHQVQTISKLSENYESGGGVLLRSGRTLLRLDGLHLVLRIEPLLIFVQMSAIVEVFLLVLGALYVVFLSGN